MRMTWSVHINAVSGRWNVPVVTGKRAGRAVPPAALVPIFIAVVGVLLVATVAALGVAVVIAAVVAVAVVPGKFFFLLWYVSNP